jgi:hypothetical protein
MAASIAQLCERCRAVQDVAGMIHEDPPGPKGYSIYDPFKQVFQADDRWPDLPELARSAASGCTLCELLRRTTLEQPARAGYTGGVEIKMMRFTTRKGQVPRIIYYFSALVYAKHRLADGTFLVAEASFVPCSDEGMCILSEAYARIKAPTKWWNRRRPFSSTATSRRALRSSP